LQKEKVERVKNFVSTIRTANVLQVSLSFHTSHVFVLQKVDSIHESNLRLCSVFTAQSFVSMSVKGRRKQMLTSLKVDDAFWCPSLHAFLSEAMFIPELDLKV
jgi:hypothetical protein